MKTLANDIADTSKPPSMVNDNRADLTPGARGRQSMYEPGDLYRLYDVRQSTYVRSKPVNREYGPKLAAKGKMGEMGARVREGALG